VTVTGEPTRLPGFHVYVVAPLAVRVDENPLQIVEGVASAVTVGVFTNRVTVDVPLHEPPLDPVTVYVVVTVGETGTTGPVIPPGFQV
jgi:hypothetical protein